MHGQRNKNNVDYFALLGGCLQVLHYAIKGPARLAPLVRRMRRVSTAAPQTTTLLCTCIALIPGIGENTLSYSKIIQTCVQSVVRGGSAAAVDIVRPKDRSTRAILESLSFPLVLRKYILCTCSVLLRPKKVLLVRGRKRSSARKQRKRPEDRRGCISQHALGL